MITRSSAIAEGLHDTSACRNIATTKHPISKRLQSTNDLKVYTPEIIEIADLHRPYITSRQWPVVTMSPSNTIFEILLLVKQQEALLWQRDRATRL